jgi:hypothetical protein
MTIVDYLKQDSEKAILNGNKWPGYLGAHPNQFNKEELIMVCNILYDSLKREKEEKNKILKPGYLDYLRNH